jgi:hypothetical protein
MTARGGEEYVDIVRAKVPFREERVRAVGHVGVARPGRPPRVAPADLTLSSCTKMCAVCSREGKYTRGGRVFCIIRICIVFCIVFVFFGAGHP